MSRRDAGGRPGRLPDDPPLERVRVPASVQAVLAARNRPTEPSEQARAPGRRGGRPHISRVGAPLSATSRETVMPRTTES